MTPANSLTAAIIRYITLTGGYAVRINNIARQVEGRFVKSTTAAGVPDVIACIRGRFVGIEVKIGRDRQSLAQKSQEEKINQADGVYLIAKTFEQIQKEIDTLNQTDNYEKD